MKTSEAVGSIIHAFSDKERRESVRRLAGKVAMMETVLAFVVGEYECTGDMYDDGNCIDEDAGTGPCLWCRAKAALE